MQNFKKGVDFLSIINDVYQCIRQIDKIAVSKKKARTQGKKHYIHSHSQKRKVMTISKEFANFCRDTYNVKKLHNVKEEHYRHFLATKHNTTLGHQRNIETALQQLQRGLQERAEKYDKEFKPFMAERIVPTAERDENIADRSYTSNEIENIKNGGVTENTKIAIELMSNLGMRVSEATSVKVENIDFERSVVSVIGKGGLYREIPLENDFKQYLGHLTENMNKHERLVKTDAKTVSDNCKVIADKQDIKNWTGTHGFRHTYARNEVDRLMSIEEKQMFERCIENYASGKQFNYGIKKHENELYNSMKSKMDSVHKNLGHGKNRFDLALRYMR